jgi:hypothetical protein
VQPGAVFVTEIMQNPDAVFDLAGEWFEIYNSLSNVSVDINGWTIRDQGTDNHTISNGGPLLVPPKGFLVLGRNSDTDQNGGVQVDYQYSGFVLENSGDEIELVDGAGTVVDSVSYSSSTAGASASLSPAAFSASGSQQAANWCAATNPMPGGDMGTPGSTNDPCS